MVESEWCFILVVQLAFVEDRKSEILGCIKNLTYSIMCNNVGIIANLNATLSFVSCGFACGINAAHHTFIYFCGKFSLRFSAS